MIRGEKERERERRGVREKQGTLFNPEHLRNRFRRMHAIAGMSFKCLALSYGQIIISILCETIQDIYLLKLFFFSHISHPFLVPFMFAGCCSPLCIAVFVVVVVFYVENNRIRNGNRSFMVNILLSGTNLR